MTSPTPSQQILIDEIQAFAEALGRRGVPHVSHMLRRYLLHRLGAPGMDDDESPVDIPGTESFLNRVNYFVTRESAPWEARVRLLHVLLEVDGHGKLLDLYHELRGRSNEHLPAVDALERALKKFAAGHLEAMYQWYRTGQPGATSEFLRLFTESSFELAKLLFEEGERRFTGGAELAADDLLPEVVVRMEERIFQQGVPAAEAQAILDRMSYLFARLSVDTLRRIDEAARTIKDQRGIFTPLEPDQSRTIQEYLAYLDDAQGEIRRATTMADYLARINARKATVNGWDKRLLVHVDMRLGLKQYHNTLTEDLLRRSREVRVDLAEHLRTSPHPEGAQVVAELHHALDVSLPVATVVELAIRAESLLRGARHEDVHARRLHDEVMSRLGTLHGELDRAFATFEEAIEAIRTLVGQARDLRAMYRSLIADDPALQAELEGLRTRVNERLAHDVERLKLPSPSETNRIYRPQPQVTTPQA